MKDFSSWSDLDHFIHEVNPFIDPIIQYDDWEIYNINGSYYYYALDDSNEFHELTCIAIMIYSIPNDVKVEGETLSTLFDCDYCGEHVFNSELMYMWFKIIKEEQDEQKEE